MNRKSTQLDVTLPAPPERRRSPVEFDGIICFGGEDWWYHNRGHYDMQMMRQLGRAVPVVYVNSLGMRVPAPREGRMFLTRVRRKLASIRRGYVRESARFGVLSPPALPGALGLRVSAPWIGRAVRAAAAAHGIRRPLVWVACPTAAAIADAVHPVAHVYQRTDRYECFDGVDAGHVRGCDRDLKERSDLTLFCSTALFRGEAAACRRAGYVDHGVDLARFEAASARRRSPRSRPRVGFIGGIDAHTFDPALFRAVAGALPEAEFVLVGACSLPSGWCGLPNVTMLGQQAYESIPDHAAACDVLIMPWRRSPWIEACHPVKLKEYLASGRPIVSTPFAELRRYEGLVAVAAEADAFAAAVRAALADAGDAAARRDRVRGESWRAKADQILRELAASGVVPAPGAALRPAARAATTPASARSTPRRRAGGEPATCVVLAGGLRPSPIVAATGLSVLDLWLTPRASVGIAWLDRIAEIERAIGAPVKTRIVHAAAGPVPWPVADHAVSAIIEQEPQPFRGAAGVLRDVLGACAPDENVLVLEAARYATTPLSPLVAEHADRDADVTVATNPDGTAAGIYVVRRRTLDIVPPVGFMDLKEQWLARLVDAGRRVFVHRLAGDGALPLRTREQLLAAARAARPSAPDPLRVVCPGALIGPAARVADSIVMPGATIGAGAVVERSVIGPGAVVRPGALVHDETIGPFADTARGPVAAAGGAT